MAYSPAALFADEPAKAPAHDIVRALIAEALEIRESGIKVANVVTGTKRTEDGFEYGKVFRVTAVHPVLLEGRMVRLVRCYDFFWNEDNGWFHQEIRESRGGEEVWIWSEKKGRYVVR